MSCYYIAMPIIPVQDYLQLQYAAANIAAAENISFEEAQRKLIKEKELQLEQEQKKRDAIIESMCADAFDVADGIAYAKEKFSDFKDRTIL